jgi:hypothetical protein
MPVKSVQYAYMDCGFKRQEMKINLAHMHGLSQSERLPRQKKTKIERLDLGFG